MANAASRWCERAVRREDAMAKLSRISGTTILCLVLLTSVPVGWCASSSITYAGNVLAVDTATGRIVIGDMGPLLNDGRSEITSRTILLTPSTEFTKVARTRGVAPSGWIGDFVTTHLAPSDIRPGDFAAVTASPGANGAQALKITVVETSER